MAIRKTTIQIKFFSKPSWYWIW